MKSNSFTAILLGVLTISALSSVVLCALLIQSSRELRSLQGQAAIANFRQQAVTALAYDAAEYSKKNPQIDPILEAAGLKAHAAPAAAAAPVKPATK